MKLGGLHLDDIPEDIREAIKDLGCRIRRIVVEREDDGYHYTLDIDYDEEGLSLERAIKLLTTDTELARSIREDHEFYLNNKKFWKLNELISEVVKTIVELANERTKKSFGETSVVLTVLAPTFAQLLKSCEASFGKSVVRKALEIAKLMKAIT